MLNDCIKSCAEICMKCIVHTALDIFFFGGGGVQNIFLKIIFECSTKFLVSYFLPFRSY